MKQPPAFCSYRWPPIYLFIYSRQCLNIRQRPALVALFRSYICVIKPVHFYITMQVFANKNAKKELQKSDFPRFKLLRNFSHPSKAFLLLDDPTTRTGIFTFHLAAALYLKITRNVGYGVCIHRMYRFYIFLEKWSTDRAFVRLWVWHSSCLEISGLCFNNYSCSFQHRRFCYSWPATLDWNIGARSSSNISCPWPWCFHNLFVYSENNLW